MDRNTEILSTLSNLNILDSKEKELSRNKLIDFWNFIHLLVAPKSCTFFVRAESNKNLKEQYNYDIQDIRVLLECIFMVGEKAHVCWSISDFLDPNNITVENFKRICDQLLQDIDGGCKGECKGECKGDCKTRPKVMNNFKNKNQLFYNEIDEINCHDSKLIRKYMNLNEENKKLVNFYYLSVIHTMNSHKYKKVSTCVSTTQKTSVTNRFSPDATIYGWVPCRKKQNVGYFISEKTSKVEEIGFPSCSPAYPEQEEITLNFGILPHNIIGIKTRNNFYVNPAIFTSMDKMNTKETFNELYLFKQRLRENGLDIDQTRFKEFLSKTNFKRYYTFNGQDFELHNWC